MTERIIYWCETHGAPGCEHHDVAAHCIEYDTPGRCRMSQMRLVPLEVSEEMVEAAAKGIYFSQPGTVEPNGWKVISDWERNYYRRWARVALNAALGGGDE